MMERLKLVTKNKDFIVYTLLSVIAIIVFFVLGTEVPSIQRDTMVYTTIALNDGVMPVYPLYSYIFKSIFGDNMAFNAMVVFQGLLAGGLTIVFADYIRRQLDLTVFATVILYILSLSPFVIYLPEYNISQMILTESIAFPLTYLLVYFIIKCVYEKRNVYGLFAIITAMVLYFTRSQMLVAILYTCAILCVFSWFCGKNSLARLGIKTVGFLLILVISVFVSYKLFIGYLNHVVPNLGQVEEASADSNSEENSNRVQSSSQFNRLIMNRGLLLLHDGDYVYYPEDKQEVVRLMVDSIRANDSKALIQDNPIDWSQAWDRQGLMSEDLYNYVVKDLTDYYRQKNPNASDIEIWSLVKDDLLYVAEKELMLHWDGLLYLFSRLFFAGLQASIFFQPTGLFIVSEVITALLIILTLYLLVVTRKETSLSVQLLRVVVFGIIVYAGIVSAVHIPIQRYLVYFQGLYFVGMALVILDMLSARFPAIKRLYKRH